LISAKYNECEDDVPELRVLEEITQQPISSEDILNFELLALKRMGWKLNARTPVAFVTSFCFAGVLHTFDSWDDIMTTSDMQANIFAEAVALSTVCLLDDDFKKHQASDVASAIVYWVRAKLGVAPAWRKELTEVSLCNPYTPGAVTVFHQLKALFPQEGKGIVMIVPGSSSSSLAAVRAALAASSPSPTSLRSVSASTVVNCTASPTKGESHPDISYKTPVALRVPSSQDLLTPLEQIVSTTQFGAKVVGGKVLVNAGDQEPSPISIAFND
jgi:hypothetical protein